jgi:DNA topoisomerase IB
MATPALAYHLYWQALISNGHKYEQRKLLSYQEQATSTTTCTKRHLTPSNSFLPLGQCSKHENIHRWHTQQAVLRVIGSAIAWPTLQAVLSVIGTATLDFSTRAKLQTQDAGKSSTRAKLQRQNAGNFSTGAKLQTQNAGKFSTRAKKTRRWKLSKATPAHRRRWKLFH